MLPDYDAFNFDHIEFFKSHFAGNAIFRNRWKNDDTKALVELVLQAEMTELLGHEKQEAITNSTGNTRNGKRSKTALRMSA